MQNYFQKIVSIGFAIFFYPALAQTNRVAPRSAPPPRSPPVPAPKAVSPRTWSPPGRPSATSFGAGLPLRRSVFVPNVSFEMSFHSRRSAECPAYFTALDEASVDNFSKSYSEYNGEAPMRWFSSSIKVVFKNQNRAVWKGVLRPEYLDCNAEASMTDWSSRSIKPTQGHLMLTLKNGIATLTADVSRYKNARLNKASVSETGRPVWSWSVRTP